MELVTILRVLVLILQLSSDTSQYATINFGNNLQIFEDCLVQLVAPSIEGNPNSFIVKPLKFPIVLSRHLYKQSSTPSVDANCQSRIFDLKNGSGFLFAALPPQKLNCFVQIFLNEPCFVEGEDSFHKTSLRKLDPSFLSFLLDRRFKYNFVIKKCCTFFVHVETKQFVDKYFENEPRNTPHYINEVFHRRFYYILDHSTKLSFLLEYSDKHKWYDIGDRAVETCPNIISWLQIVRQHCGKYFRGNPQQLAKCKRSIVGLPPLQDNLVPFSGLMENRKSVENMRSFCTSTVFNYMGEMGDDMPVSVSYLRDWNKITGKGDLDPLLLGILFPNSSVMEVVPLDAFIRGRPNFMSWSSINPALISTRYDKVEFITCVPISKPAYLSLAGYASAFDINTWLMIVISLCLSMLLWYYTISKNRTISIARTCFFYNILVGQSTSEIKWARLLTGCWVLAGLFLTNNYQGNNIDQLTTPLTPKTIETFEEIFSNNLTVYSLPTIYKMLRQLIASGQKHFFITKLGRMYGWSPSHVKMSDMYLRKQFTKNLSELELELERFVKVPHSWNESKSMIEFDYYITKVSECGKDVFVDTLDRVTKLRFGLIKRQTNRAAIATSKTSFGSLYQLWNFLYFKIPLETLERRVLSLIQSGIIHLWKEWKFRIDTWNDTLEAAKVELPPSASAKALSADGNIVVVLYLHLALLSLSILLLLYECRKLLIKGIVHLLLSTVKLIKQCWKCRLMLYLLFPKLRYRLNHCWQ